MQPLRSGAPATADLATVFDATTLASASTTDRGVVLDEGLPKVTGDLTWSSPPIALVGLGDQGGKLTLVTAASVLDVHGQTQAQGGRSTSCAGPTSCSHPTPPAHGRSPATTSW